MNKIINTLAIVFAFYPGMAMAVQGEQITTAALNLDVEAYQAPSLNRKRRLLEFQPERSLRDRQTLPARDRLTDRNPSHARGNAKIPFQWTLRLRARPDGGIGYPGIQKIPYNGLNKKICERL